MAVNILIPTALRAFTDRVSEVSVEGATVGDAITALVEKYPDIKQHLYKEGELRSFINIFVGETNIKNLQGIDTPIAPDAQIMLVPAIAGG
jgi:adenylyltransferase/sulfurtransferase